MKKFCIFVSIILVSLFTGCGKDKGATKTDELTTESVASVEESAQASTEEPEPEIAENNKKDDSKVDDKKDVGSDSGTENVVSKKEPAANVESTKPATKEEPKPAPEAPKPEKPAPEAPKPTKPATTEAPQHAHNYNKWVVDQAAYDETVVVKEAYTETVEHPEEGYNIEGYRCSYCGKVFASGAEVNAHLAAQADDYHFAAGWGSANYWVKTKDAWTETINHPAETKTVHHDEVGHLECSCGAKK